MCQFLLILSKVARIGKNWKELLYLDVQIMPAVRTLLLGLDDVTWCVGHQVADGDTDGAGYLLGGVSPSIVL